MVSLGSHLGSFLLPSGKESQLRFNQMMQSHLDGKSAPSAFFWLAANGPCVVVLISLNVAYVHFVYMRHLRIYSPDTVRQRRELKAMLRFQYKNESWMSGVTDATPTALVFLLLAFMPVQALEMATKDRALHWKSVLPHIPWGLGLVLASGNAIAFAAKVNDRLPLNNLSVNPVNAPGLATEDLRETIRAVVREELRKLFPATPQPQVASLTDVVREEVQQALGSSTPSEASCEPQAMTYSAAARRPRPVPTLYREAPPYRHPMSPARPPRCGLTDSLLEWGHRGRSPFTYQALLTVGAAVLAQVVPGHIDEVRMHRLLQRANMDHVSPMYYAWPVSTASCLSFVLPSASAANLMVYHYSDLLFTDMVVPSLLNLAASVVTCLCWYQVMFSETFAQAVILNLPTNETHAILYIDQ
ncbi:hypothetical protein HPB51_000239 [Rhipicephalus microplus]|uniref:Uncharacterized protein n=1 Tax=Rhipicephalus microplus TaxID=6941 RepID=A0A9J6EVC4_RHIMP|nr:hypothetical protein HPB51_000239 [Rhipicephalus microplus]